MVVTDEMVEGSSSSLLIDLLESNQNGGLLSPEDVAWADSCLVKYSEIFDDDWSSVKGALLEILGLQPESHDSSAPGSDVSLGETDMEILPSNGARIVQSSVGTDDDDFVPINKETETNNDGSQLFQGDLSETSLRDAFLPHYKEDDDQRMSKPVDSGFEMGFPAYEMEPSTEDIFKVWDLGIPSEEDELVKQLNNALSESSIQSMPSVSDDSGAWKNLKDESLDNLIAGIADLSLNQHAT